MKLYRGVNGFYKLGVLNDHPQHLGEVKVFGWCFVSVFIG